MILAATIVAASGAAQSFAGAKSAEGSKQPQAEQTKINVPVVINVLKGIGCTDEEMFDLVEAALKRANEVLKQAGVTLTRESIYYNVNDASNADMDAMLQGDEVEQAHNEGVDEVTGLDGLGGPRTGLKITFAKSIEYGGVTDGAGLARKCSPWVGIVKSNPAIPHDEGETLAHEVGHALGWLDDLTDPASADNLMFWEAKDGSDLKLTDEQKEMIRKGAAKVGTEVVAGESDEEPKKEKPRGIGSATGPITQDPGPDGPAKSPIWVSLRCTADDLGDPTQPPDPEIAKKYDLGGLLKCWDEDGDEESTEGPSLYFIYHAINADDDDATGVNVGPFVGVEWLITVALDTTLATGTATLSNLENGEETPLSISVGPPDWMIDGFELGSRVSAVASSSSLSYQVEFVHGQPDLFNIPGATGRGDPHPKEQISFSVYGTDSPQFPPPPPGPLDSFFDVVFCMDNERPTITAPGAAQIGEVIQVEGDHFTPGETIDLTINDDPVAQIIVDGDGAFSLDLPLPPGVFGADGHGYDFLKAKHDANHAPAVWISVNTIPGDLNNDGIVNGADLAALLAAWGSGNAAADLNGDGIVNGADLAALLANWS